MDSIVTSSILGGGFLENIFRLSSFIFVSSITPGPNNLLLAASGFTFGFKRTIPHLLGVPVGAGIMLFIFSIGIGELFLSIPNARLLLNIFGTLYLMYLLWNLNRAVLSVKLNHKNQRTGNNFTHIKPMTFLQSMLFQFSNPKVWIMAVTGVSLFIPPTHSLVPTWVSAIFIFAVFFSINVLCISTWALSGSSLHKNIEKPWVTRSISACLIIMTIYTIISIWLW